jgi:hypothetical protein
MTERALPLIVAVTVFLGILAAACVVVGIVLWCIERTRSFAPFMIFTSVLAMLGAAGGSWGLGYSVEMIIRMIGSHSYGYAFWGWLVGLPVGGFLGGSLGLRLARSLHRKDEAA